ncbi:MAG: hypothetical protein P8076_03605 [Gammaproteobacteria bacterium]
MQMLLIAQGPREWASSRLRAWNLADQADWIHCCTAKSVLDSDAKELPFDYDVYVFQKWMDAQTVRIAKQLRFLGKQVWLDLADPLWWLEPHNFFRFLPHLTGIVVNTDAMQRALREAGASHQAALPSIAVIPDRMPPDAFSQLRRHEPRTRPVCLWFGRAENRVGLQSMQLSLHYSARMGQPLTLRIVDDGPARGVTTAGPVEYRPWQLHTFQQELLDADVVLVPPYPGRWGELKSNNRSVTAWCAGIPTDDGWQPERLLPLLRDASLRARLGAELRREAERHYRVAESIRDWHQLTGNR